MAVGRRVIVELSRRMDTRIMRFYMVGGTGVLIGIVVLWISTQIMGLPTAVGGLLASVTGTTNNFLLNDAFTWRDRRSSSLRMKGIRLLRYYSTTALGNVVSLGLLVLLADGLRVHVLISNLLAVAIGGSFNFLLHNLWTWRRSDHKSNTVDMNPGAG